MWITYGYVWISSGHVIIKVVRIAYDFTLGISRLCIASLLSITKMGRGFNLDVYYLDRSPRPSCPYMWVAWDISAAVGGHPRLSRLLVWIAFDFILGIKRLWVRPTGWAAQAAVPAQPVRVGPVPWLGFDVVCSLIPLRES